MIISHKYRFIFIHINKCAGTSMTRALMPLLDTDDIILGCTPEGERLSKEAIRKGELNKHSSAEFVKNRTDVDIWQKYYKFCFVRNPWDLLVSRYHWALKTNWNNKKNITGKIKSLEDFEEYVLSPLCNRISCSDFIYSEDGELLVDFVGRYENLERDFSSICKTIGFSAPALSKHNQTEHEPTRHYYNHLTRELVTKWFAVDINNFGYAYEDLP